MNEKMSSTSLQATQDLDMHPQEEKWIIFPLVPSLEQTSKVCIDLWFLF